MPPDVEFSLLGPLAVCCGGTPVQVPRGKQRAVLAALLLNAGRVVSVDELAATLWGPAPPPSASASVRNYVKRLRQTLGEAGWTRISTQPPGYLILADPGDIDVGQFETLLEAALASARNGSWQTAAAHARSALGLWRGEPLADVTSELLASREVPRLAELRLQALEVRLEAGLHLGHESEVIAELRRLVGDHPLREHLHALLMQALYRAGRQGEALAAYRGARAGLVEELGAEPGPELRRMQEQILAGDPALAEEEQGRRRDRSAAAPGPAVPRQLPAPVAYFTGRDDELAVLTGLLKRSSREPGTLVISAIGGTAGVGKTALAVNWAHQYAARFPGGQLYVDLRGYDPGQPVPAAEALATFLRALGVPAADIPAELDERAACYRSLLADRRMLVLLDNAGSVEQVRPLLPGAPCCVTVVTSRDALAGLVARDGAARLDLDLLPLADAVSLLADLIGDRVTGDPAAAAALAVQCARLPLALRIAAELAVARPAVPLAGLVGELADQQQRLDLLNAGGDPRSAVRDVFSWSYRHLDAHAARMFRLLGLHPGPDLDCYAAAALAGTTLGEAGKLLDVLARAYLIRHAAPSRFTMHDLLRAYAGRLAAAEDHADAENGSHTALSRLFGYYLHSAATAMDVLFPAERDNRPRTAPPDTPEPPLAGADEARSWLDSERANLVSVAGHTAGPGWPGYTTRLADTLFRYLDTSGHFHEASVVHAHALRAAQRTGDRAGEATALTHLGVADVRQRRCDRAEGRLQRAQALFREAGDRSGEARALVSLGLVHVQQGRLVQADEELRLAVSINGETGNRAGETYGLANLGLVNEQLGRYTEATGYLRRALDLCRADGNRFGEAHALTNLADVETRLGRLEQAIAHQQRALALFRQTGNPNGAGYALTGQGDAELRLGRCTEAIAHHQEALVRFRETGDRSGEAQALNGLGESLLAVGRPDDARAKHTTALSLAGQIGDGYQRARAHNGLGQAGHVVGDLDQARRHWQEAIALYASVGAADADRLRAWLADRFRAMTRSG
jgi:DNA-binding SARP family transcriptional activator/tetratricopeptide (TPR) repeat protein